MAAAAAAAGSALVALGQPERTRAGLAGAFAVLWAAQLAAWALWTTFVYPFMVSPLRLPEPAGGHWLLGHGRRLLGGLPGAVLREWVTTVEHDGMLRYRFLFNRERLLVASPAALAEVLVTKNYDFTKPAAVRGWLGRLVGSGLLLAEGDAHRVQRRKLQPAFAFRHVKGLYPVFWRTAGAAVRAMAAECGGPDGGVLEVGGWASRCTLDIIGAAGMGVDFGAVDDADQALARTYARIAEPTGQARALMVLAMFLPGWLVNGLPLRRNDDVAAAARRIRGVCRDLVAAKRAGYGSGEGGGGGDIVSVALASGLFADDALVDQLMTFLAAGHDTTASALTWAAYLLARHPDVQRRLRTRCGRLPPADGAGAAVASADVDGLPYLQAVCCEVLRVFSPVPQTLRQAARDTTVQGVAVRRGTVVVVAPWATNADPALWGPDAGAFRPERWLAAAGGNPAGGGAASNYAFLTFLHGPRSCIGAGFARAELACLLAAWVGRFEFALADERLADERRLRFRPAVTARPAGGMHLRTRVLAGW